MKYIGNKKRLLDFIDTVVVSENLPNAGIFIDIFTGTTNVAQYYKKKGYQIITNDFMTYSYIFQQVYIKNNCYPKFENLMKIKYINPKIGLFLSKKEPLDLVLKYLNKLPEKEGFIFENYAPGGSFNRQFFSNENAKKIDVLRNEIELWKNENIINEVEFYILLASLIDAADFVANISGTYGAYLKIWRSMALKKIEMKPPAIIEGTLKHEIFKYDSNDLIRKIKGDILYVDPPYNARQYAPNFHVLETIACWDNPVIKGKTGLRPYENQKSLFSQKTKCKQVFSDLIEHAEVKFILVSYNNEGIIPDHYIKEVLNQKGKLKTFFKEYRRFRTEKDHEKRRYKVTDDKVTEVLHLVKV